VQTSGRVSSGGVAFRCLSPEEALAYVTNGASGSSSPSHDPADIQAHIDECDGCRRVLAEAVRSATQTTPATGAPFRTLADGQSLLGRYEIRRFIARGGMGEVYEAFDSVLGERVALKTLLATALDDERAIGRLADEVRLARKVTHRNVCRILEFGVYRLGSDSGIGIPFLTMEFLTGEALSRRIAAHGPLAGAAVMRLVTDVAAGMAAIHAAGIVHRDFKTENVFLVPEAGGDERAVIMDFGLARGFGDDVRRGSSTAAAGTPDYMAPEQVEGKPPTPAFDIYALGVVIFELLTGSKPFAGASPYMAALSRLQRRAPAPSELVPGLAPVWDVIVGRCLERQPERRFARVEEIAGAMRAAADRKPAPRRAWIVAGVAAMGLVAGAVVMLAPLRTRTKPAAPTVPAPAAWPVTAALPAVAPVDPAPAASPAAPPDPGPPAAVRPRAAVARPRRHKPGLPAPADGAGARAAPVSAPAAEPAPDAPASTAALLREAETLMLAGEVARACQLGHKAASAMPSLPAPQLFLGKCYIRMGDAETAHRHYRRYLELAPDAPDQVFIRGILERRR
jgi:tRNA A-37 threonylcarbamoyl transferase component Bud32